MCMRKVGDWYVWKKKRKRSQRAVALGSAQGLSQIEAVKQAGYSDSTAEKTAYRIVRLPQVQSVLTEGSRAKGEDLYPSHPPFPGFAWREKTGPPSLP